jgi:hypothetical protein
MLDNIYSKELDSEQAELLARLDARMSGRLPIAQERVGKGILQNTRELLEGCSK